MTHIGVICDRGDVQQMLPQVVIGNHNTFLARDVAALRSARPLNVRLLRQRSAWSNSRVTAALIRQIAATLAARGVLTENVQVVIIMDAVKLHYTREVLRACKAVHFWLIIVPALMTFLLQPLDTHTFAAYKACFQLAYQMARSRSASPSGDVTIAELLPCIDHAIQSVLETRLWSDAFDSDGFGHAQRALGHRVKHCLELESSPVVPSTPPTDDELRLCFPRKSRPDFVLLRSLFEVPTTPPPLPPLVHRPDDDALMPLHGVAPAGGLAARSRARLDAARGAALRLSPGAPDAPPLLRRYRRPPSLD